MKPLKSVLAGILVMLFVLLAAQINAQTVLPLPNPIRITTELLTNPDFELDTDEDKVPDGWTGKNTTLLKADKVKCDKPEKLVAHSGACAFMFRGNTIPTAGKIQQTIVDTGAFTNGAEVTFSVYLDARSAVPEATFGKAKIAYSDGSSTKFQLKIPAAGTRGVEDYVEVSDSQTVVIPVGSSITKVKVDFRYKEAAGKFLIDDASFGIVTTPDVTPTSTETSNVTATATATDELIVTPTTTLTLTTATHTQTATLENPPSNTPSHTPTWTNTPSYTPTFTNTPTHTATFTNEPITRHLTSTD